MFQFDWPSIRLIVATLLTLLSQTCIAASSPHTPPKNTVVLSLAGWTPSMKQFQTDLMHALLDASQSGSEKLTLKIFDEDTSVVRVRDEVAQGERIHMDFSAMTRLSRSEMRQTEQIPFLIYRGLLGLRQLIIRESQLHNFSNIPTREKFLTFRAGQGADWEDVRIYRNAGADVIESISYTDLYPMLIQDRFDYLPLSILELEGALKEQTAYTDQLTVVPDTYIYYPIPIYINVTKRYPQLVNRIKQGVKHMEESEKLDHLFQKHFQTELKRISDKDENTRTTNIFILDNHWISPQENQKYLEMIKARFFKQASNFVYLNPNQIN